MPNVVDRLAGASSALAYKAPCRLSSTANMTLSGYQTIDGTLPTSSEHVDLRRILVKNQTDAAENGIYIMDTSTWERTKDFDGGNDFRKGTRVHVWGGSTQSGGYVVTSSMDPDTFTFDEDDITFTAQAAVDITNWAFADGTGIYDDSSNEQLIFQKTSGAANYLEITNSTAGSAPQLSANGSDAAVDLKFTAKSTGKVTSTSVAQFDAAVTSSAITASGAITANAGIVSSAITASGAITASSAATVTGTLTANGPTVSTAITASGLITGSVGISLNSSFTSSGNINAVTGTTITVGGVAGRAIMLYGSTTFGIYAGSSAPAIAAGRGSIYLRDDGGSSLTRAYIQSSGSTNTWVGLLTTA